MSIWYDRDWRLIKIKDMDDAYVGNLIIFTATGGGWSADIVLSCLDDLYEEARKRDIFKGLPALAMKIYTRYLWSMIAKKEKIGMGFAWRTPKWVRRTLRKIPTRKPRG